MIPIVTPEEMRAIDAAAAAGDAQATPRLIERAGSAVAWSARRMLGGTYGRRIIVIAGRGNNGNDGRVAARRLGEWGARVTVHGASDMPAVLPPCDLLIDAAYGTGFRGAWTGPDVGGARVLAVDIPSGVDGLTGEAGDGVIPAERTVTLAALKPGLLFGAGRELSGVVECADIGLPCPSPSHLVEQADVRDWWRPRRSDAHKWRAAVRVVAGSAGMTGAAHLAATAAQRAGAGMVHLSIPGGTSPGNHEYVQREIPKERWSPDILGSLDRFQSLVVGPGLGRADSTVASIRDLVSKAPVPTVVDGDGLFALAWSDGGAARLLHDRNGATVLTPHDGEFAVLSGGKVPADRLTAARKMAFDFGVVVLLKGPATVVAEPGGRTLVVTEGDDRLATAGTGDVLSGIVGALLAQGLQSFEAAAAAAWLHGRAGKLGPRYGLIASDLVDVLPSVLDSLVCE